MDEKRGSIAVPLGDMVHSYRALGDVLYEILISVFVIDYTIPPEDVEYVKFRDMGMNYQPKTRDYLSE